MAMQIAALPINEREHAFELARETFEDTLFDLGQDPHSPFAKKMIDSLCDSIRMTVVQITTAGRAN